ncbi:MAG: adenylosuccinate synthetase [Patescibacteria group bacterium]
MRGEIVFVGDFLFGDEGKARVVDYLLQSQRFGLNVRFQGGPNAGHRVTVGDKSLAFHQIPSSAFTPSVDCALGTGMVIDPVGFLKEVAAVKALNLPFKNEIYISPQAHLIFPWHKRKEAILEKFSDHPIGTTGKGIGLAYASARERWTAIRVADVLSPGFEERYQKLVKYYAKQFRFPHDSPLDEYQEECRCYYEAALEMARCFSVTNMTDLIWKVIEKRESVLVEGAQGGMLDIDHGTYPFVTSSTTTLPGLLHDIGWWDKAYMATKAYTTRVGNGPLVGELFDVYGEIICDRGHEIGETTGRKRRVSWLDTVLIRWILKRMRTPYGQILTPVTKLDVLDTMSEVKIIIAYQDANGRRLDEVPSVEPRYLETLTPVYFTLPGWQKNTGHCRHWEDLPDEAKGFLKEITRQTGLPIPFVTVGPERSEAVEIPPEVFA